MDEDGIGTILAEPSEPLHRYRIRPGHPEDRFAAFRGLTLRWNARRQVGFADPLPDEAALTRFYAEEYREGMGKARGLDVYRASPNYRAQVRSQVDWVMPLAAESGRWLDVGGGYGLLMWQVSRELPRWERVALESDPVAIQDLTTVAQRVLDPADFWAGTPDQTGRFDLISLSHVLEHLRDPWSAIRHVADHLTPGGLMLIEVPNDAREELTRPERESDLPHLWFWSLRGLVDWIEEAGFQVLRQAEVGHLLGRRPRWSLRLRRRLKKALRGHLALLDDPTWYAEGPGRTSIRVLARR